MNEVLPTPLSPSTIILKTVDGVTGDSLLRNMAFKRKEMIKREKRKTKGRSLKLASNVGNWNGERFLCIDRKEATEKGRLPLARQKRQMEKGAEKVEKKLDKVNDQKIARNYSNKRNFLATHMLYGPCRWQETGIYVLGRAPAAIRSLPANSCKSRAWHPAGCLSRFSLVCWKRDIVFLFFRFVAYSHYCWKMASSQPIDIYDIILKIV